MPNIKIPCHIPQHNCYNAPQPGCVDNGLWEYEFLCSVKQQLETTINTVNELIKDWACYSTELKCEWTKYQTELLAKYNELQSYVNNYFTNLNIQTEINNKIHAMVEDGSLLTLMTPTINDQTKQQLKEMLDNGELAPLIIANDSITTDMLMGHIVSLQKIDNRLLSIRNYRTETIFNINTSNNTVEIKAGSLYIGSTYTTFNAQTLPYNQANNYLYYDTEENNFFFSQTTPNKKTCCWIMSLFLGVNTFNYFVSPNILYTINNEIDTLKHSKVDFNAIYKNLLNVSSGTKILFNIKTATNTLECLGNPIYIGGKQINTTYQNVALLNGDSHIYFNIETGQFTSSDYKYEKKYILCGSTSIGDTKNYYISKDIRYTIDNKNPPITTGYFYPNSIDGNIIKDETISGNKLEIETIEEINLADNIISTNKIIDQSISTDKLMEQSVTTNKLNNEAVTTDKIQNQAISGDKIYNNTKGLKQLGLGSIYNYNTETTTFTFTPNTQIFTDTKFYTVRNQPNLILNSDDGNIQLLVFNTSNSKFETTAQTLENLPNHYVLCGCAYGENLTLYNGIGSIYYTINNKPAPLNRKLVQNNNFEINTINGNIIKDKSIPLTKLNGNIPTSKSSKLIALEALSYCIVEIHDSSIPNFSIDMPECTYKLSNGKLVTTKSATLTINANQFAITYNEDEEYNIYDQIPDNDEILICYINGYTDISAPNNMYFKYSSAGVIFTLPQFQQLSVRYYAGTGDFNIMTNKITLTNYFLLLNEITTKSFNQEFTINENQKLVLDSELTIKLVAIDDFNNPYITLLFRNETSHWENPLCNFNIQS